MSKKQPGMAAALTINTFALDVSVKDRHNLIKAYSERHMSRVLAKEAVLVNCNARGTKVRHERNE